MLGGNRRDSDDDGGDAAAGGGVEKDFHKRALTWSLQDHTSSNREERVGGLLTLMQLSDEERTWWCWAGRERDYDQRKDSGGVLDPLSQTRFAGYFWVWIWWTTDSGGGGGGGSDV